MRRDKPGAYILRTLNFLELFCKSKLAMSQLSEGSFADHSKRSKLSSSNLTYRFSRLVSDGDPEDAVIW